MRAAIQGWLRMSSAVSTTMASQPCRRAASTTFGVSSKNSGGSACGPMARDTAWKNRLRASARRGAPSRTCRQRCRRAPACPQPHGAQVFLVGGDVEPAIAALRQRPGDVDHGRVQHRVLFEPVAGEGEPALAVADAGQIAVERFDEARLAYDHLFHEVVEGELLPEAVGIDAGLGQHVLVPGTDAGGIGVIALDQHAIDVEENGPRHLPRAGMAPSPLSTSGGMPRSRTTSAWRRKPISSRCTK